MSYLFSFAVLVAAVLLRWLLDPLMGDTLPLVTLFRRRKRMDGRWLPSRHRRGHRGLRSLFVSLHRASRPLGLDNVGNIVGLVAYLFTCSLI